MACLQQAIVWRRVECLVRPLERLHRQEVAEVKTAPLPPKSHCHPGGGFSDTDSACFTSATSVSVILVGLRLNVHRRQQSVRNGGFPEPNVSVNAGWETFTSL